MKSSMNNRGSKKGFTILELLIVIAVVGILAGVAMVRMSKGTEKANVAKSQAFSDSVRHSLMVNRISEWKFDESSGAAAPDTAGTNPAVLVNFNFNANSGWKTLDCVSGSCLKFDGSNDYINISADLGDPSEMTIDLWFKKTNINAGAQYLMDARNGGNWWFLQDYVSGSCTDSNGNVCFNGRAEIKSKDLANNVWENVVLVQNTSFTKIYLNGELKATGTGANPDIGQGLRIGTRYTNSSYFNGFMDEVRLYDKALAASSVRENYAIGLGEIFAAGGIGEEEYRNRLARLESAGDMAGLP